MHRAHIGNVVAGSLLAVAFFVGAPGISHAAVSATAATDQVIPPGGVSCATPQVESTQPYIYDGSLDSFDITISDASYVALSGTVGDTVVPFRYMTRRVEADGSLLVHADIPSTPIQGTVAVSVTLLSARPGQPVCQTTVKFDLTGPAATMPVVSTTPSTSGAGENASAPATNSDTTGDTSSGSQSSATTTPGVSAAGTFVTASPVLKSALERGLANSCTESGSFELWFVLLALYAAIVAFIGFTRPLVARGPQTIASIIIVPLIILVAFWYFAVSCRAADWIPVVILAIGMLGLLVAFRNDENPITALITVPQDEPKDAKKK